MPAQLEQSDLQLLDAIQQELPLVARPFEEIARRIGSDEQSVIERLRALKTNRVVRQISAIFDSRTLGYTSCLVAAKVVESRIDQAAAEISKHPGVSHNYRRNHAYNLW